MVTQVLHRADEDLKKKSTKPSPATPSGLCQTGRAGGSGRAEAREGHVETSVAQSQPPHPGTHSAALGAKQRQRRRCALAVPHSQAGAAGLGRGHPAASGAQDKELPAAPGALTRASLWAQPHRCRTLAQGWLQCSVPAFTAPGRRQLTLSGQGEMLPGSCSRSWRLAGKGRLYPLVFQRNTAEPTKAGWGCPGRARDASPAGVCFPGDRAAQGLMLPHMSCVPRRWQLLHRQRGT